MVTYSHTVHTDVSEKKISVNLEEIRDVRARGHAHTHARTHTGKSL